ncbi:MAG TPA: SdpI family protein [Epulopiscium sp.]|nr:SdpI family protein [Candidatus Epulonipiscium sp.]
MKKSLSFIRVFFLIISVSILYIGIFVTKNNGALGIMGALILVALIVLDIKAPQITNLSADNPKIKTIRTINRISIFIIILIFLIIMLSPQKLESFIENNERIVAGLISLFMMVTGNISPKIPFNRYVGLRLPWTIRDGDTWKVAHRILGYISFPIAIFQLIFIFFYPVETVMKFSILTWIIIPGLYSLWFYYRKLKGNYPPFR